MENNTGNDMVLMIGFIGLLVTLLGAALVKYWVDRATEIGYVKRELNRAYAPAEISYWKRELCYVRWSLIPGLRPEWAKAIHRYFRRGKHAKKPENKDPLSAILFPALIGISICALSLVGSTYAWFTASSSVPTQSLRATNYAVEAIVTPKDGVAMKPADDGSYQLVAGTVYDVTLLEIGGQAATGYCQVIYPGGALVTQQFPSKDYPGRSIQFTLQCDKAVSVRFVAQWGTSVRFQSPDVADGADCHLASTASDDDKTALPTTTATRPSATETAKTTQTTVTTATSTTTTATASHEQTTTTTATTTVAETTTATAAS